MNHENIEDIYELSPLQRGMLFQSAYDPESGVFVEQMLGVLQPPVDVDALEAGWRRVVAHHGALRASFYWEELDKPLQVVHRDVELPVERLVWRSFDDAEVEERLQRLMEEDRRQGFDLSAPPLLRLRLIALRDERYRFLWSYHHLLLDGWSLQLALRDLLLCYQNLRRGREPELNPAPGYGDYIGWLQDQDPAAAERFWRTTLEGFEAPTPLGPSNVRGAEAVAAGRFETAETRLPRSQSAALTEFARRHHLSPNTLFQGAWALLLGTYSGEHDVVFGNVVSSRPPELAGVEEMVGLFINTLPVRARLCGDDRLLPWLRDFQVRQAESRQFEYCSLAEVRGWSEVPRDQPLFESILVFENFPVEVSSSDGEGELRLEQASFFEQPGVPVGAKAWIIEGHVHLLAGVDRERFGAAGASQVLHHLKNLLLRMVEQPEARLEDLSVMNAAEGHTQLREWNDHRREIAVAALAQEIFDRCAHDAPDRIAVEDESGFWSYEEIERRADRVAVELGRRGVGPESPVGVFCGRSVETLISLLAILKAGGGYLPLDPSYPVSRLTYMLRDSGAKTVLAGPGLDPPLEDEAIQLLRLEAGGAVHAAGDDREGVAAEPRVAAVRPDNVAYLIYTSGSTGEPKGVQVSHRNVCGLFDVHPFGAGPDDRALQFANMSFDISIFEIFTCWRAGATLCLAPKAGLQVEGGLFDWLQRRRITRMVMPPSILSALSPDSDLPALDTLIVGGEACSAELVRRWSRGRRMRNGYGPSETTVCATMSDDLVAAELPPIGRPFDNSRVYLLDPALRLLPAGAVGEIYIADAVVSRGYLGRPARTAGSFLPDPFAATGTRMYRTGDLARHRPDGQIEFIGRRDNQVKIRGFRVELGEVEKALGEHPELWEVAVVVPPEVATKRLVAYVVPRQAPIPAVESLRQFLAERLPDYMVPSRFVALDTLPLTANGKLDLRALPDAGQQDRASAADYVPPATENEEILAAVWGELLSLEQVGVEENFFHLGGDSVLCLRLVARAREEGLQISARQVFDHQTIRSLAAVAEEVSESATQDQGLAEGEAPLTPIQAWFLDGTLEELHHFNQSILLEVDASVPVERLDQAFRVLIQHHDALRLRFHHNAAGWRQEYGAADEGPAVERHDLSHLSATRQRDALELICAETQGSLDVAGPIHRFLYFDYGADQDGRLLMVIHHLVIDVVSWRILLEDFQRAYGQLAAGQQVELPPKTTSFGRWAQDLREHVRSGGLAEGEDFWRGRRWDLAEPIPQDGLGGDNLEASAATVQAHLDETETLELLRTVTEAYRAQPDEVLLAALCRVFSGPMDGLALQVDLEVHGREDLLPTADLSRTVGWFTAFFPLLLDLDEEDSPGRTLNRVKETVRRVPNRGLDFGLLRRWGDPEIAERLRDVPPSPILLNYQGEIAGHVQDGGDTGALFRPATEDRGSEASPQRRRSHALELSASVTDGRLELSWAYSPDLHSREFVSGLMEALCDACRWLIDGCSDADRVEQTAIDYPLAELEEEEFGELAKLISAADSAEVAP